MAKFPCTEKQSYFKTSLVFDCASERSDLQVGQKAANKSIQAENANAGVDTGGLGVSFSKNVVARRMVFFFQKKKVVRYSLRWAM